MNEEAGQSLHRFRLWYWAKRRREGSEPRRREILVPATSESQAREILDQQLFMTRWHVDAYLGVASKEEIERHKQGTVRKSR